ncbi:MAG: ribonuclease M5 [Bacillota bacterium]|nr:ribonuclease M5 [Bacillota bacterium]
MKIKEIIVVEGRDDTDAIKKSVDAVTIETHGYGITKATWELIEKAYKEKGIIVFTDPDHAGEQIRRRILEKFPDAKEAFLDRKAARKDGDIGIENASPESIREALAKAHCSMEEEAVHFTIDDMMAAGLVGQADSSARRQKLGKSLGIGYGNGKIFLQRLNKFGISREEFEKALQEIQRYR